MSRVQNQPENRPAGRVLGYSGGYSAVEKTACIRSDTIISDLTLNESMVLAALKALEVGKATGSDEIPAKLLKETAAVIAPSLCKIFNKSLQLGSLSSDWKLANVVPVHKKGAKDHVEYYRPISLLPTVSKVFELCVLNSIKDNLYQVISPKQYGFCTGRSCVTNLLEALDPIGSLLDSGSQVDTIYFDMSKAFEKVSHRRLVHKLLQAGFSGNLPNWFCSYLSSRRQRITVLGATSEDLPVTSGVPQGSIHGPALFVLYVNDLPEAISSSSRVLMFADGTKIFREIKTLGDASSLQEDLGKLATWSQSSGLLFNEDKWKAQHITRKTKPILSSYKLNNTALELYAAEKDLGVWISKDLTWYKQVNEQSSRANKLLGYLRGTRGSYLEPK